MKTKKYTYTDFLCEDCKKELHTKKGLPFIERSGDYYCYNCAMRNQYISPMEWLGINNGYEKAEYDEEHDLVIAYRKWGRGYMKHIYPLKGDE